MKSTSFESSQDKKGEGGSEEKFHFKEMTQIESAMKNLVWQLKKKIEQGAYDTLISDDAGGRIPTLVLRKIIKALNPDKKLNTFFIAAGKDLSTRSIKQEEYNNLLQYLGNIRKKKKTQKALLITQFIHSGESIINLSHALEKAGIKDFDVSALRGMRSHDDVRTSLSAHGHSFYMGTENEYHMLSEGHEPLSGVRKQKSAYRPFPERIVDAERKISHEEWREIFGIKEGEEYSDWRKKIEDSKKTKEFEHRQHEPLTDAEKAQIQKHISHAREDVGLLAERVVNTVWGKQEVNRKLAA